MNPVAAQTFARAGIPLIDKMTGGFRNIVDVEGDALKYLSKLPEGLDKVYEAQRLGGPELVDMVESLKASGLTVDEFMDRQKRLQTLTEGNRRNFEKNREAIDKLKAAFYDLGVNIAGTLAPALTPLLQQLATWVETHQPQIIAGVQKLADGLGWVVNNLDTVKTVAEAIAALIGVQWVAAIVSAGTTLAAFVASPAFAAIAALAASIYAIKTLGAQGTGKPGSWTDPKAPNRFFDPTFSPEAVTPPAPAATPTAPATPAPAATPAPGASPTPAATPTPATGPEGGAPPAFKAAIEATESPGGVYNNAPMPGHSATGPRQMMPDTFRANALPGEDISNPADNRRVSDRLIDKLWKQYGGDPRAVAYAYANGSVSSPDRNPGYVDKVMTNYQAGAGAAGAVPNTPGGGAAGSVVDQMVSLAGTRGAAVREFLRDPQGKLERNPDLGLWCAEFVSAYLEHIGVKGVPAALRQWAPAYAKWGQAVAPEQTQKGDVLLNKDLQHVGVATGRTWLNTPGHRAGEVEEISSNSIDPVTHKLLNIPGLRWRSDVTARRSDELARLEAKGPDATMARGTAPNGSVDVTVTHKNAPPGVVVASTATGSGIKLNDPRVEHQRFGQP
jgi:hypothetical protein